MYEESWLSRRKLLRAIIAGAVPGIAGCSFGRNDESPSGTADPGTASTPSETERTPTDGAAPTIRTYDATPSSTGTALEVSMEGEDDRELGEARIVYGDRELAEEPDGATVTIAGTLQDTASSSPDDGRVVYVLTDVAGNKTRKHAQPDGAAPDLALTAGPTRNTGEITFHVDADDDTGLGEVVTLLNGQQVQDHDARGQTSSRHETTITYDPIDTGRMNAVTARATDWNDNATEKDIETYARKYDSMEDTRLNLGVVYQPYLPQFGHWGCTEQRTPEIGHYETPYPEWVFNRHIDQLTWGGVERIMVEYLGNENTDSQNRRFLESDLVDQADVEPFITLPANRWGPDAPSVDSYRDDLLRPHMQRIRDQMMGRENVSTFEGRPVVQMWNPVLLRRDHYHDIVEDEWGGYEEFFDDMRNLLHPDGPRPFLVGGTNWWGEIGYQGDRRRAIAQQFDAVTTWVHPTIGEDNQASQQEVRDWVERNFEGHRDFVDSHDMEFFPMGFPGFNERECREERRSGRRIPRSLGFFHDILQLADEYRTTDFVNVVPYTNWAEGTQWEPGTFMDEDYDTAYLDVVQEFQQRETG
jgi:hypothetical protein